MSLSGLADNKKSVVTFNAIYRHKEDYYYISVPISFISASSVFLINQLHLLLKYCIKNYNMQKK